MRLIDAEDPKLLRELKFIREAEYQIYGSGSWGFTAKCEHAIEDAPTVQPELHWIPVTERLPENGRQVLVYARSVHYALAKYDEMLDADGTYKKQWVTFDAWKPFYSIKEVIAWCELPNLPGPYKGVTT